MIARLSPRLAAAIFFGGSLLALALLALNVRLEHDEHQFVASAALLARGELPYRDFAYFHTPNLVGVYALLFQGTDRLLLAARLFSALCAWLTGIALSAFAWHRLAGWPRSDRALLALGVAAVFFLNPVTFYTFPKAWNNALPTLLTVLAFGCHCRGAQRQRGAWFFAGGLFVALAAGCRISFAPLALPFLVAAGFASGDAPIMLRVRLVLLCGLGMLVGALPVLLLAATAPAQFWFDNFIYNSRINSLYRLASGDTRSALASKGFFILVVLANPANLLLALAFTSVTLWPGLRRRLWRRDYPFALLLALLPFVILGVLAPTPSYTQYYYVLAALGCLGISLGLPFRPGVTRHFVFAGIILAGAIAAIGLGGWIKDGGSPSNIFRPSAWPPLRLHEEGVALRRLVGDGPVLTLAPIIPLEGGLDIYAPFVTGSFAWRTASFVTAEDRQRYGFAAEADLPALLAAKPPAAILLGYEKKREAALLAYVKAHGYRRVKLPEKISVWLPPTALTPR